MEQQIHGPFLKENISPEAFHLWATHYYKCYQDFQIPEGFSPVPYFLLCRAIELELKSNLLLSLSRNKVKKDFGHNLLSAYQALETDLKSLSADEENVLNQANVIYSRKGFEYFDPEHALIGYSSFPDLPTLYRIASKLIAR